MKNEKITWKKVKEVYELKNKEEITKLDSSNAEKLLTTPELVLKYIEKYGLDSSNAEKIFSKYIEKVQQ